MLDHTTFSKAMVNIPDREEQDVDQDDRTPDALGWLRHIPSSRLRELLNTRVAAAQPRTRCLWGAGIVIVAAGGYIITAGGAIGAIRNVVWLLTVIFSAIRDAQLRAESWPPLVRVLLLVFVALPVVVFVEIIRQKIPHRKLRISAQLFLIWLALGAAALLVSFRPSPEPVPTAGKIGIAMLETGQSYWQQTDLPAQTIDRAVAALQQYARSYPNNTHRGGRRRPIEVSTIDVSHPTRALEEILLAVKENNLGYVVVALPPSAVDYEAITGALAQEAVTFLLAPAPLSQATHEASFTVYPSPEREGEQLAQSVADARLSRIAILQHRGTSTFEERAASRFEETVAAVARLQPYFKSEYRSTQELIENIDFLINHVSGPPDYIYLVDTTPLQVSAWEELERHNYRGDLALTSFAFDYVAPESLDLGFHVAVPWPIRQGLERRLRDGRTSVPAEASGITVAGLYTSVVLADHAHHAVPTLARKTVADYLHDVNEFQLPGATVPLGSLSFGRSVPPPKSRFNVTVTQWRPSSPDTEGESSAR